MAAMAGSWVPLMRQFIAEFGGPKSWLTALVLSSWWLPAWMLMVSMAVGASFALARRMRSRTTLLASALAVGFIEVVVTWWGVQLPIVALGERIGAE